MAFDIGMIHLFFESKTEFLFFLSYMFQNLTLTSKIVSMMINYQFFEPRFESDVKSLILNIQQNEFLIPITAEDQPDLSIIPDFYQIKNGQFWVALHQGELVGTIALIDCGEGVGCIRKMFVKKEFRGKPHQIAQQLLNLLIEWSTAKGFKNLYLGTIARLEAAMSFYQKNGFRPIPKAELPEVFPAMSLDTHFFQLALVMEN